MTFTYAGYDRAGARVRGSLEAPDEREAARLLLERGVFARSVRPARAPRRLSASDRAALYHELGALLGAGIPLDRALAMLRAESPVAAKDARRAAGLSRVAAAVREGRGLSDALAEGGTGLDSFEKAALAAAETSATLPEVLARLASFLDGREAARGRRRV